MSQVMLKTLLQPWIEIDSKLDRAVKGISSDTQMLQAGDIFVALKGAKQDGCDFIQKAIEKGSVAILCDHAEMAQASAALKTAQNKEVPLFAIKDLRKELGHIAARFYHFPSKQLNIMGVTGTNGKTSCTQWLAQAFNALNRPCGVIGTLGYGFPTALTAGMYTTPFSIEIQQILAGFVTQKAQAVAMEVSSHGLSQHRLAGTEFDLAVFTNLSHDHLDYHGNLERYALAKKRLFDWPELTKRVFNLDDTYGKRWFFEYMEQGVCYGYSLCPEIHLEVPREKMVYTAQFSLSSHGIQAIIHSPWGEEELKTRLVGRFNLSNLLAVLTSLCVQGVSLKEAMNVLSRLKSPPGRMQIIGGGDAPLIVVDYAHTPDALEQALKSLTEHCAGKLWCVFGCGGDRDMAKRPIMAQIAEKYADYIIVTDDNPRYEDPTSIIRHILTGLSVDSAAIVEQDRRRAIVHAVTCAQPEDIILIAGKGHELYQQIGDKKFPFSDLVEAQSALNQR